MLIITSSLPMAFVYVVNVIVRLGNGLNKANLINATNDVEERGFVCQTSI